ncbi:replicative DNA helicase [Sporolactobacillus sp. KGMB 08714]|uniref:replicative DNA helicase n=1 Tax=Sporolactobacillus sp. KGMB 08714 TaxID=3064704 RepID=UPI002FBE0E02
MEHLQVGLEAEQAVLGAILCDGSLMDGCWLTSDKFKKKAHQILFSAYLSLSEQGVAIDPVTVSTELGDQLGNVGGTSYLLELSNSVATTTNFDFYQRTVDRAWRLRESRRKAERFVQQPSEEGMELLARQLDELAIKTDQEESSPRETLEEIAESLFEDQGELTGISTGITDLDQMTGGLQAEDLIVVAGRPSMGKTAFTLHLAHSASQEKVCVDFFTLEMPQKALYKRLLSAICNVDAGKWRNPKRFMTSQEAQNLLYGIDRLLKVPLAFHDESMQTLSSIRAKLVHSIREMPDYKHLAIIDYLGLIEMTGHYENRVQAVSTLTRELKQMARKFHLPIVLVCQLSRNVETRMDKHPMMSDLRESGSIEQDADAILFLYRDDYYDRQSQNKNIVELILAKQRNGPVGTVEAVFVREYAKFLNIDRRHASLNSSQ